jgi:U4/U6 small nuclear ribonucleoprotein PRP31
VKKEVHLSKKQEKAMTSSQGQSQVDSLSTSLAFTPVQSIELANPKAPANKVMAADTRWFSNSGGFASAVPKN